MKRRFLFVDLFAGCGGLSEGFSAEGFKPVAHIEMKPEACQTLQTREAYRYAKAHGNLGNYYDFLKGEKTRDQFLAIIPKKANNVICQTMDEENTEVSVQLVQKMAAGRPIDLVIGGPPCQAYSLAGRSRVGKEIENDPRNFLYRIYFKFIDGLKPKFFVFENVGGITSAGRGKHLVDIIHFAERSGYKIEPRLINTGDFGVLQNRRRMILFGYKKELVDSKDAFLQSISTQQQKLSRKYKKYIVNDLLSDLPPLNVGGSSNQYNSEPTEYLLKSGIRRGDEPLTWHQTRVIRPSDREIYSLAAKSYQSGKQILYSDLPERLQFHKNKESFLDRFKVVEGNDHCSHTMVAHISKDGHYYIHPDVNQNRSISVREAARIQSFPDDYYFEGSRTAALTQIGNAVPPLLSKALARAVLCAFEKINK